MEIPVKFKNHKYNVVLDRDVLSTTASHIPSKCKALILTDDGVPSDYVTQVKKGIKHCDVLVIPHGENSKCLERYSEIVSALIENQYTRKDYIIALGGGVVSDLAGYVASTYKRGMNLIIVPTTLLSMVDASIGGKVAINFKDLKNVIGTFYHPKAVIIDLNTLKTLPNRHFYNGMVEVIKTGMIGDEELYKLCFERELSEHIEDIVYRSLKVKIDVVTKDENEANLRKILNYGHTFGHAFESYYNMEKFLHGEAVALGILLISKGESFHKEIENLFKAWGIRNPYRFSHNKLISFVKNDKKNMQDIACVVEVHKIGEPVLVEKTFDELMQYLEK